MASRASRARHPVRREEILDYETYAEERPAIRSSAMAAKDRRRVHLGGFLTFLFENHETIRYQVLEMVRVERMVRERDIRHEISTYNELLGGLGELGATLLIEIEDPVRRDRLLHEWRGLVEHLYLRLGDGHRARAGFDPRQVGEERLSSVQYLRFDTGGGIPVAVGCDLPGFTLEVPLTADQRAALAEDLAE